MSNRDFHNQHQHHHHLPLPLAPSYARHSPLLLHHQHQHHHHQHRRLPNNPPPPPPPPARRHDLSDGQPAEAKWNPLPYPFAAPDHRPPTSFEPAPLPSPPRPAPSRPSLVRDVLNPADTTDGNLHHKRNHRRLPEPFFSPPSPFFSHDPPSTAAAPSTSSQPDQKSPLPGLAYADYGSNQPAAPAATFAAAHQSFPPWPAAFTSPPMSPSSTRRSNGYIDLTSPDSAPSQRRPPKRGAPSLPDASDAGEGTSKRRRGSDRSCDGLQLPTARKESSPPEESPTTLDDTLQKQRAEAVKAQQDDAEKSRKLTSLTCVICLDTPNDLTATACGHVFCHECLVNALIAGEQRSTRHGESKKSQCPVCRKAIQRTKATDVIPLLMKKGLSTQPRRASRARHA